MAYSREFPVSPWPRPFDIETWKFGYDKPSGKRDGFLPSIPFSRDQGVGQAYTDLLRPDVTCTECRWMNA